MSHEIQAMNGDSQVHQLLSIKEPDQKQIHATANPATNGLSQSMTGDTVTQ